jgi:hypothetical protein
MRKFHTSYNEDIPKKRKRSIIPALLLVGLLTLAAPVLYEGGLILVARWQTLLGTEMVPATPILDAIADRWRNADYQVRFQATHTFIRGNWQPGMAVPVTIVWAVVAAMILRRTL